jgi:hypothetical protein
MPFFFACDPACMQVSHARPNFDGPSRSNSLESLLFRPKLGFLGL